MLHRKYIPIDEDKVSTKYTNISICIKKMMIQKVIILQMKTKALLNMVLVL